MSAKKKETFTNLSIDELKTKTKELEEQLFKLKMQKVVGQLTNTALVRTTRKSLARVKTQLSLKGNEYVSK